jgi:formylglycine-generating enzyme required for sulfatase activity
MMKHLVSLLLTLIVVLKANYCISQENDAGKSQEVPEVLTPEQIKQAEGRALLMAEVAKNEATYTANKQAFIDAARGKLRSLQAIREKYRQEEIESRRRSYRPGLGGAFESSNLSGIQAAADRVDEDIKKAKAALQIEEQTIADEKIIAVWGRMPYETREAIWNSGCLSSSLGFRLKLVNPMQDLSKVKYFLNSAGMKIVEVPAGDVRMGGSPYSRARKFFFTKPLLIGEREVSQSEFQKIMKANPSIMTASRFKNGNPKNYSIDSCPVEHVTWYEAVRFCVELSKLPTEKAEKRFYRLPTEWEWEYACRAKTRSDFHFGNGPQAKSNEANLNFTGNGFQIAEHPIPSKWFTPNSFGLFDMHGNVSEWCGDWFDSKYYEECPDTDPPGPTKGLATISSNLSRALPPRPDYESKVHRGGSFFNMVKETGSKIRSQAEPDARLWIGFRVVCEYEKPSEIARAQYQEMLDFENGKPREGDARVKKEYLSELQRRRALLESNKTDKTKATESWHQIAISTADQNQTLQDLCSTIAYQYSHKDEKPLRLRAFKDAARYGELALEDLKSRNADISERLEKIIRIATYYENAEDLPRATEMVNKVLAVLPSHEEALAVQERLRKQ